MWAYKVGDSVLVSSSRFYKVNIFLNTSLMTSYTSGTQLRAVCNVSLEFKILSS